MPSVALLTLVNADPEPEKLFAIILVADIVVPVRIPHNKPPDNGKKLDNVDDNDNVVPFLYISLQYIYPKTSNFKFVPGFVKPIPILPQVNYKLFLTFFLQKSFNAKLSLASTEKYLFS